MGPIGRWQVLCVHHRDHDVFLAVTVATVTAVAVTINAVPHSTASVAAMALPSVPATYGADH